MSEHPEPPRCTRCERIVSRFIGPGEMGICLGGLCAEPELDDRDNPTYLPIPVAGTPRVRVGTFDGGRWLNVGHEDGIAVLQFNGPVRWARMDARQVRDLIAMLAALPGVSS